MDDKHASEIGQCRICLDECPVGQLLTQPCGCTGTLRHVHPECLQAWAAARGPAAAQCEVCMQPLALDFRKAAGARGVLLGRTGAAPGPDSHRRGSYYPPYSLPPPPPPPPAGHGWPRASTLELFGGRGIYGHVYGDEYGGGGGTGGGGGGEVRSLARLLGIGPLQVHHQALLLTRAGLEPTGGGGGGAAAARTTQSSAAAAAALVGSGGGGSGGGGGSALSSCCWVLLAYAVIIGLLVSAMYAYAITLAVLSYDRP
ncbi:putative E3 ubiquitin-protein ligase march10 [Pleodorina starrii]|uniref:E3 ubiquitin-protein ligase march10 n=1 Tax=Pleodorina starrii TaxID=330485 RepID=A0A9W6EWG3_9CHLO|nr:putative E3 ubiquitin-protein ligase march10 [Pleodorina starrii]GLC47862.1 putative E3 ubiquitin-protein ligase march10 [Pleodorina starrii]GLC70707.1 putative E3 ubiquitin-protein ligase march10 [Pleodorina starrii]